MMRQLLPTAPYVTAVLCFFRSTKKGAVSR